MPGPLFRRDTAQGPRRWWTTHRRFALIESPEGNNECSNPRCNRQPPPPIQWGMNGGAMDPLLFSVVWVFGWVLLLLAAWHLKGLRRQKKLELIHRERMMAMEKGIPLPELP